MKINYEIIEHTADIGIRIKALSLDELFIRAALAVFDMMGQLAPNPPGSPIKEINKTKLVIRQKSNDLQELFINWLNELLSLSAVYNLVFTDIVIHQLNDKILEADIYGEDIKNFTINREIKAATYYQLKIERINDEWSAEVIFDV